MPDDHHASDAARRLLLAHVDTFDKLEVLVHLWQHRARAWTAQLVADHLKMNADVAAGLLDALCGSGLVSQRPGPPPQYGYAPRSEELACAADALAALRDENRLWITNLMLDGATARLQRTFVALSEERRRPARKRRDEG
jgi:hypothetical protein